MKVLIVDDDPDMLVILKYWLQRHHYQTITASSGPEAFDLAAEQRPDVILLDMGLPRRRGGVQVCRRIRSMEWGKGMRIIGVSGWTTRDDERAAFDAGFDDYLHKPASHEAVLALIGH